MTRARPNPWLQPTALRADKERYERQIEATDEQIDALVYQLYGLTDEEVAVVEETNE